MKLTRRTVIQAAAEVTRGIDPASGYTGLLAKSGAEISISADTVTREILKNSLSPEGHVVGKKQVSLTVPLELRGAGDAGGGSLNTPELDVLYKACGMQRETGLVLNLSSVSGTFVVGETITNTTAANTVGVVADIVGTQLFIRGLTNTPTDTDAISGGTSSATATCDSSIESFVYRPESVNAGDQGSLTLHYFMDGIRHVATAGMGTFNVEMSVGQIPSINFTFSAVYAQPTDTANATPSYLDLTPAPVINAGLKIGSLDTSLVTVNSLNFDLGNEVQAREDIQAADGLTGFIISGRDPTGSIDPEVAELSDFNPFIDWSNNTLVPIGVGIGGSFGERIRISMPKTQYTELPYSDRNGIAAYNLGFRATGNDDEMMIIYW